MKRRINTANADIRQLMRINQVSQWQIAEVLGCCENTVARYLRTELDTELKKKYINAINLIVKGR